MLLTTSNSESTDYTYELFHICLFITWDQLIYMYCREHTHRHTLSFNNIDSDNDRVDIFSETESYSISRGRNVVSSIRYSTTRE